MLILKNVYSVDGHCTFRGTELTDICECRRSSRLICFKWFLTHLALFHT